MVPFLFFGGLLVGLCALQCVLNPPGNSLVSTQYVAKEKKMSMDEKTLRKRFKKFARFLSHDKYEEFISGLLGT